MMLRSRTLLLLCPVSADAIPYDEAASTVHVHLPVRLSARGLGKRSSQQRAHIPRANLDLDSVSSLAVAAWIKPDCRACWCGHSYIGQTQRNLKFRLDEHNPLKSNHQATNVAKHLYTYPDHFMNFKNPEILASAFNYHELLIKETLLIQEQQPEINVDNFSTPLYLFNT